MINRFAVSVILLVLGNASQAQVVRTWVSASGNDTNPCTRTAPCRTFAAGILAVDEPGEVVVLDSAGFGPVTIDKSVMLVSPPGIYAAIAPTSGNAVTVTTSMTPTSRSVVLRNLTLVSHGAAFGVFRQSSSTPLHVEGCTIMYFGLDGVHEEDSGGLTIHDSVFRSNGVGVFVTNATAEGRLTVDRSRFEFSGSSGVWVSRGGRAVIRDSLATFGIMGFRINVEGENEAAKMDVENSIAAFNSWGFIVQAGANSSARMNLERCRSSQNAVGIRAQSFAMTSDIVVRLSNCVITENLEGVVIAPSGATVISRGNNTIEGNETSDGTGLTTFNPK